MKLLYKASIAIILFGCHLISAIADNTQFAPQTTISETNRHNNKNYQYHNYDQINAIVRKNLNHAKTMLQQNLDFAKASVSENLQLAKYTIEQSLSFAQAALYNNTITHNEQLLKASLDISNNLTNKTLETTTTNIDNSLTTTQTGISETFKTTNVAIRKSLDTYATTTFHNGINLTDPTARHNTNINPKTYSLGSAVYNSDIDIENHDEDLADSNRDYH